MLLALSESTQRKVRNFSHNRKSIVSTPGVAHQCRRSAAQCRSQILQSVISSNSHLIFCAFPLICSFICTARQCRNEWQQKSYPVASIIRQQCQGIWTSRDMPRRHRGSICHSLAALSCFPGTFDSASPQPD